MMSKDLATAFCEAQSRAERAEARVAQLEADLAACREFQDIAEARGAELEAALEGVLDYAVDHYTAEVDHWGTYRQERNDYIKAEIDRARAALGKGE
jgi:hypothetical protein